MTNSNDGADRRGTFGQAVGQLPSWKRKLLTVSLTIGVVSGALKGASLLIGHHQTQTTTVTNSNTTSTSTERRGFFNSNTTGDGKTESTTVAPSTQPVADWMEKSSGWFFELGLSLFVGMVIGTMFRMFIKTMAVLAALVVGGIVVASYFRVIDVDTTKVKQNSENAIDWAKEKSGRFKELIMGALPSTSVAAVGFFLGFKR